MQSTLQALFRSTIAEVVVQGFRSSSVPVTPEGYTARKMKFPTPPCTQDK